MTGDGPLDTKITEQVQYTNKVCAYDPRAARTRLLLLRLEKQAHKAGWDNPGLGEPMVFHLTYDPSGDRVKEHWVDEFTHFVRSMMDTNGGNAGQAMLALARTWETLTRGDLDALSIPGAMKDRFLALRAAPGEDLFAGDEPGWKLYGYGARSEVWHAVAAPGSEAARLAEQHRLDRQEGREDARVVWFAARDGLLWHVMRRRDHQPVALVLRPESDSQLVGNMVHALGRMTNAVTAVPAPVRPRNPLFRSSTQ